MRHTKLSDNLDALAINPQTEVLLVQFTDAISEQEEDNITHTLRDFSKKTGIRFLMFSQDVKLTVVETKA